MPFHFKADKGMIGFVGESGSGKSTIASLLMGQYSNYRGELKLSGYEIKRYKRLSIYRL